MITIVRDKPFPYCRYCGKQLKYYIFGMQDEDHAHPACKAKYLAKQSIEKLMAGAK